VRRQLRKVLSYATTEKPSRPRGRAGEIPEEFDPTAGGAPN
jgi:hypothetical protein